MLNYFPRSIMVKFENVDWHVDRLPVGVFPLFPVERTWELGETKIVRKGFTLIPDFANTRFVIQDASLRAAVADCGDVHTTAPVPLPPPCCCGSVRNVAMTSLSTTSAPAGGIAPVGGANRQL